MQFEIKGRKIDVVAEKTGDDTWRVTADGTASDVTILHQGANEILLTIDGRTLRAAAAEDDRGLHLWIDGESCIVRDAADAKSERSAAGNNVRKSIITAAVPGKVIKVAVEKGTEVKENDLLAVIEAMKMENQIRSPRAGKIKEVFVAAGAQINFGAKLVEFE